MSSDPKKDLTGVLEYAKKMQDSGKAMPIPEGSIMEEQKIEKLDAFESLDDYAKSNPMPEVKFDDGSPEPEPEPSTDFPTTDFQTPESTDFPVSPSNSEGLS